MDHGDTEAVSDRQRTNFAFLNHSPVTIPNKLPPDVDDKPLARQKRKRTSPEDQAILEAAYQQDPKPDKESRLRLVSNIALSEKEIQIWFQNRRQTSRRKSRPLLPHEIAQYQLSKYEPTSSFADDAGHAHSDDSAHSEFASSADRSSQQHLANVEPASGEEGLPLSTLHDIRPQLDRRSSADDSAHRNSERSEQRRSLPSLQHILNSSLISSQSSESNVPISTQSSSKIRLSMTSEGCAQISTKTGFTPSPPRPENVVQQNVDAVTPILLTEKPQPINLKRSASGRSRDSRAWEFWCDKDSRTELEIKAEKDGKGSAADAIGVIRAASSRKVLQPVSVKQNSTMLSQQPWHNNKKTNTMLKRPSLQRAHTSNGRLQHSRTASNIDGRRRQLPKMSVLDSEASVHIPGNESDKENWSPGGALPRSDGKGTMLKSKTSREAGQENRRPEDDDEIAAFMRGSSSSGVSETEELDCVQGLLSLSQGRWVS